MLHGGKAYLPEIEAYEQYFGDRELFEVFDCMSLQHYSLKDFDVAWHFMGLDFSREKIFTVHEYQSLSCGRFNGVKDFIKRRLNVVPDLRVFQSEHIRRSLNFKDSVTYCYREMGIDERFFGQTGQKDYDFVYLGNIGKERGVCRLLDKFKSDIRSMTLLVIGDVPAEIYRHYKVATNIIFSGRVAYYDVPKYAVRARYGINYIENKWPYARQTSTKLLEYCALGLPVITTSYEWVNRFENRHHARFYKITEDLNNFNIGEIEAFPYTIPEVDTYEWKNIIENSGIHDLLVRAV